MEPLSDLRRTLSLRLPFAAVSGGAMSSLTEPVRAATMTKPATTLPQQLTRIIPGSGERLPAVGMGTWITFNVGDDEQARRDRLAVMRSFFANGGGMVDTSPMYGSSQDVVGDLLRRLGRPDSLFSATKVWTGSVSRCAEQINEAYELWGLPRLDLIQVHNLVSWSVHLPLLVHLKESGALRYIGVTTSHGRRHTELLKVMQQEPLDFVQLSYNPIDRQAEAELFPLARERGIAIIVNRPFRRGSLIETLASRPLPAVAASLGCTTWAQLLLKWVLGNPVVTCVIPATTKVAHMEQNMAAGRGRMPDSDERDLITRIVAEAAGDA